MKLFSEIYSTYYRITEEILSKKTVTKKNILNIISQKGFSETILFLAPELLDEDGYGLLKKNGDTYHSILKKSPEMPLTLLEKKWLCAVLHDRKSSLFIDEEEKKKLLEKLGVSPLFRQSYFQVFDQYSDGDPYENKEYISHFRNICTAIEENKLIIISFQNRKDKRITHYFKPVKIEYSSKNNRFRVHAVSFRNGKPFASGMINLSSVTSTQLTDITPEDTEMPDNRCSDPLIIKISSERNAVNRFMMEFAEFEKISEYDEETSTCTVTLWYNIKDETELLIRILSFGPVAEVISPDHFREKIRERVVRQYRLLAER